MSHALPEVLCLRFHRSALRLRFLTRGMALLYCATCETFR